MHSVTVHMNPWEHCPECGALLVTVPGGWMCPHCSFESEDPEERLGIPITSLPTSMREGARFQLMDDGLYLDEAA
jgi:hypothetical protein